jgi:hypothetical protein
VQPEEEVSKPLAALRAEIARLEAEQELCRLQSRLANLTAHPPTRTDDRSLSERSGYAPSQLITINSEGRPSKVDPVEATRQPPRTANADSASLSTGRSESSTQGATLLEDPLVRHFHQTPWVNALEEYKVQEKDWNRKAESNSRMSRRTADHTPDSQRQDF